ncbi:transposase [Sulfurimonas sp. RIFOXYB12_FULL_35_9]|uniref:transposase n=1 Tax=Sulfurimonas sp. RIFOXYB12_FULL_35_9 TaxID=1802256 RepID=UPI000AF84178|nr:transposase [Sulfurimonas sp. RIFOXYB12_FULL_35_9]
MYPSDLTDDEWEEIKHFFERPDPRGNKGYHDKRDIINAIFYVIKGGIQWRMMPIDFPPWQTVYNHFSRLNKRGIWEQVLDFLNIKSRIKAERKPEPSYAIVDSQSVKTIYDSKERGFDGGKKSKRKKKAYSC